MNESRNYARHVGGKNRDGRAVEGTKEIVFFSGEAPMKCEPQEHWTFYLKPAGTRFRGRLIGVTGP